MQFYTAKKKPVNVPILSLLDILAILLIYTVVSSEFTKEEKNNSSEGGAGGNGRKQSALRVDTPSTDSLPTKNVNEERTQLVVSADGQLSLAGLLISKDTLVTYLEAMKEQTPSSKLEVKADKGVTLEQWVFILESLKKAGISASDVPWLIKDKSKSTE